MTTNDSNARALSIHPNTTTNRRGRILLPVMAVPHDDEDNYYSQNSSQRRDESTANIGVVVVAAAAGNAASANASAGIVDCHDDEKGSPCIGLLSSSPPIHHGPVSKRLRHNNDDDDNINNNNNNNNNNDGRSSIHDFNPPCGKIDDNIERRQQLLQPSNDVSSMIVGSSTSTSFAKDSLPLNVAPNHNTEGNYYPNNLNKSITENTYLSNAATDIHAEPTPVVSGTVEFSVLKDTSTGEPASNTTTTETTTTTTATTCSVHSNNSATACAAATTSAADEDPTSKDYYFDSYAHHAIHEEMLKDDVRTRTYEMAIMQNKHLFHDKIVLDVGCGTGILSMFAAQAGAKHVYAVDCSSIINQAQKIIERNGFSDRITMIRGKVEEIELPVQYVDIIISEWMGYFLLYESMLDTVLFARDKWLVPNSYGIIFPDKAVLYLTAIEDANVRRDRFDYWDDVYGFDMSPIKEIAIKEPVVDVVDAKSIVTDAVPILHIDILTCTKDDLDFVSKFKLQAHRNDYIHGLVAYFECAFTQIHKPIGFSTSPYARYTHWKQTILYLQEPITICAGETLIGELSCTPNKRNRRDLDIGLLLNFKGRYSKIDNERFKYRLR